MDRIFKRSKCVYFTFVVYYYSIIYIILRKINYARKHQLHLIEDPLSHIICYNIVLFVLLV